ncbi:MAG TPA: NAD-binding protein [Candidatus Dormibacteraeota bacterium]|nr:NAD-binding protein [Candidatus Dormibacteraeota bacterium]
MATNRTSPTGGSDAASFSASHLTGHFIVCGLDELAFRAAEELDRLQEQVVVVTPNTQGQFQGRIHALGLHTVHANYREDAGLRKAGIMGARAIIIAGGDDVGNIHAALSVHELNPGLRVVVRIFDPDLGRQITSLLQDCEVLSSSTIAAPAFVEAAVRERFEQVVEVADRVLVLRRSSVFDPDVVLPIAGEDGDGRLVIFPTEGEDVLCLSDTGDLESAMEVTTAPRRRRRRLPSSLVSFGQLVESLADGRLRYVLGTVVGVVLISSLVLHFAEPHWSFIDAVYFTVTTITTIGYGDFTLGNAPWPVMVFGIFLELVGAAVIAMFFAVVTDTLVGTRLHRALGGIHGSMDDHVVVCGLGNVGHRVAEEIHRMKIPIVAMEVNESQKAILHVRRMGIPVLIGDAREVTNLQKLETERARCVIVCTDDDITNLEIALNVRSLSPECKVVLQLHDPDLAARVQRAIGLGIARSTAGLAAPAFVSAALRHRILTMLPVGDRTLVVARASVVESADAVGRSVQWLLDGPFARVLLLTRGSDLSWRPPPETVFESGDELVLVSTRKGLDEVLRRTELVAPAEAAGKRG